MESVLQVLFIAELVGETSLFFSSILNVRAFTGSSGNWRWAEHYGPCVLHEANPEIARDRARRTHGWPLMTPA